MKRKVSGLKRSVEVVKGTLRQHRTLTKWFIQQVCFFVPSFGSICVVVLLVMGIAYLYVVETMAMTENQQQEEKAQPEKTSA